MQPAVTAKEAPALSRLAEMAKGKRVLRPSKWPELDLDLLLRVLSCAEVQDCHAHAITLFKKKGIPIDTVVTAAIFEDEVMTQLLHHACRDPFDPHGKTFALSADDLRENTTPDQRAMMFDLYRDLQQELDPFLREMSPSEFQAIVDAVKKKDARSLNAFGSFALASYLLSTDSQPST